MQFLLKLLRSTSRTRTVLGILVYSHIHSGSCAPAARNLSSLVTLEQELRRNWWRAARAFWNTFAEIVEIK